MKELVPVLVNCFEEFVPAVQAVPSLDTQSFDCMLCLLQSIDQSISFFLHLAGSRNLESQPSKGLDAKGWAETISTISKVLFKKLPVVFPLNSIHQFSEKVNIDMSFGVHFFSWDIVSLMSLSFHAILWKSMIFFSLHCYFLVLWHLDILYPIFLLFLQLESNLMIFPPFFLLGRVMKDILP